MTAATELEKLYNKDKKCKLLVLFSFFVGLIVVFIVSISVGAGVPGFNEAMQVIFSKVFPFLDVDAGSQLTQTIIMRLRLPRIILAIITGAGLAASGATMQGVLRNSLVSSYSLGICSAAGFGASLAIVFGISITEVFGECVVVVNAFIFSILAMLLVYGVARLRGISSETIILVGVASGFFFSALLSLVQYVAPEPEAVRAVVSWLMGGLNLATWESILIVFPIVTICIILMFFQAWNINVLCMGEEVATSLGVNTKKVLVTIMVLNTLTTASIISFTGVIGFVGLIAPHIARIIIGNDHRYLIPTSALVGACLLLCADTASRLILQPAEIPVGMVTALLGVPFFIYILISKRRQR